MKLLHTLLLAAAPPRYALRRPASITRLRCRPLSALSGDAVATVPSSLLSLPLEELSTMAGGDTGARHIWRLLRRGLDPITEWEADTTVREEASRCRIDAARRQDLSSRFFTSSVAQLTHEAVAMDGTRKLLLKLSDGLEVEAVLIPPLPEAMGRAANARAHTTLCISSQVGCRMACSFCATGRMGLVRSLTSDEILAQAFEASRVSQVRGMPPLTSIVFMGMGEPSDNADAVRTALECLTDERRFAFARSKVLVSTVAPTASAFAKLLEPTRVNSDDDDDSFPTSGEHGDELSSVRQPRPDTAPALAWSLHAADETLRQLLVPTAVEPPEALRAGLCAALSQRDRRRRRVLIEVTLSGFASIYFEKVIKMDPQQLGIWERNFQLALGSMGVYVFFIIGWW